MQEKLENAYSSVSYLFSQFLRDGALRWEKIVQVREHVKKKSINRSA